MAQLGKLWAGNIYGTNTGNIFVELTQKEAEISGILRLLDPTYGVTLYKLSGTFDERLHLKGEPTGAPPPGVQLGSLEIEGRLTEEGQLRGVWRSSIGTGGTFALHPHDINSPITTAKISSDLPEQIYVRNIKLGAVRLYVDDVRQLIKYLKEDFSAGRVIVTYNSRGSEATKYAEDFLADTTSASNIIEYLKFQVQEPEAHGINKLVVVELNARGVNEVRVQGIKESWVIGRAEAIAAYLKKHQRVLITTYKKFGLNLNLVIFLATIVLLPSINSIEDRAIFVIGVFSILRMLLMIHERFVPIAAVQMGGAQPSLFEQAWPTTLSWFIGATSSLAAAYLFYWLTK